MAFNQLLYGELIWKSIFVLARKLNAQIILITILRDAIYAFKRT
jgi:hypothetical protein